MSSNIKLRRDLSTPRTSADQFLVVFKELVLKPLTTYAYKETKKETFIWQGFHSMKYWPPNLATRSSSPDLLGQLCFKVRYQQEAALTQTLTQQHNKHSRVR